MPDRLVIETWGNGPYADLIPAQDLRNAETFREAIERPLRERTQQLAKQRETYCRELLQARLPRRLHRLIDRPKQLKAVLRVVPRWQPTLTFVALRHPLRFAQDRSWATQEARYWEREQRVTGKSIPSGGLVFTYTDPSGLPAEVYGSVA